LPGRNPEALTGELQMRYWTLTLLCISVAMILSCAPKLASFDPIPRYGDRVRPCENPGQCAVMVRTVPDIPTTNVVVGAGSSRTVLCVPGKLSLETRQQFAALGTDAGVVRHVSSIADRWLSDRCEWLCEMLAPEVERIAPLDVFVKDYITREERLAIDRIIVIHGLTWRVCLGRDGTYTDACVNVTVYDGAGQRRGAFEVWGRQRGARKTLHMEEALQDAFGNLVRIRDFSAALELG